MAETGAPGVGDGTSPSDPAYWATREHRVRAPEFPPVAKLSCPHAECQGTAYGDGAGGFMCTTCHRYAVSGTYR